MRIIDTFRSTLIDIMAHIEEIRRIGIMLDNRNHLQGTGNLRFLMKQSERKEGY